MKTHITYTADDFSNETCVDTIDTMIAKKIDLLIGFNIVDENDYKTQAKIIKILNDCGTETQMTQCLHDVIWGNESLKELLKRKGV